MTGSGLMAAGTSVGSAATAVHHGGLIAHLRLVVALAVLVMAVVCRWPVTNDLAQPDWMPCRPASRADYEQTHAAGTIRETTAGPRQYPLIASSRPEPRFAEHCSPIAAATRTGVVGDGNALRSARRR